MEPRITVITLGVDDLQRSFQFYRGLGLPSQGIQGTDLEQSIAFFDLQGGLKLAVFPRDGLAKDGNVPLGPASPTEFTIAQNVGSKAQVDAIMDEAKRAGAVATDPAHDRSWGGYSGYFRDPDGHLWEIAWNPYL